MAIGGTARGWDAAAARMRQPQAVVLIDDFADQLLGDYDRMMALDDGVVHVRAKANTLRDICTSLVEVKCKCNEGEGSEAESCSICLEEFEANEVCVKPTSCCHMFHRECLETWLKASMERSGRCVCPNCKQEVSA